MAALSGRVEQRVLPPSQLQVLDSRTGLPMGPEWAFETAGPGAWHSGPMASRSPVGLFDGTTEVRDLPRANPFGKPLDVYSQCGGLAVGGDGRMAFGTGSGEVRVSAPGDRPHLRARRFPEQGDLGTGLRPRRQDAGDRHRAPIRRQQRPARCGDLDLRHRRDVPDRPAGPDGRGDRRAHRFSQDGSVLYTRDYYDRTRLRLWDCPEREEPGPRHRRLAGHHRPGHQRGRSGRAAGRSTGPSHRLEPGPGGSLWANRGRSSRKGSAGSSSAPMAAPSRPWPPTSRCGNGTSIRAQPLGPPIENDSGLSEIDLGRDGRTLARGDPRSRAASGTSGPGCRWAPSEQPLVEVFQTQFLPRRGPRGDREVPGRGRHSASSPTGIAG